MLDFYDAIANCPVDVVYIGETVCSKRREFRHGDWIATGEKLLAAGKEVVFSTLALVEAQSELGYLRRLCDSARFMIEANDMSAVQLLAGNVAFVGGPSLGIYNQRSLERLVDLGLSRWVPPVEMTLSMYAAIRDATAGPIEYELLAWGRLPLAWSARCYTARAFDLNKDDCGNRCIEHPDGLRLDTRDNDDFLIINGIQTMSARTFCRLVDDGDAGIADLLRVSPQSQGTEAVLRTLDGWRRGDIDREAVLHELAGAAEGGLCNGYWHGEAGMTRIASRSGA